METAYLACPHFRADWQNPPTGYYKHHTRLYHGNLWCVPTSYLQKTIDDTHRHQGVEQEAARYERRHEHPQADSKIRTLRRTCATCQACINPNRKGAARHMTTPIPSDIFSGVCIDFVDLPMTTHNRQPCNKALIVICQLSGFVVAIPSHDTDTAETVANNLWGHVWSFWGIPSTITADNDPRYTTAHFRSIAGLSGIHLIFSTPYRAQGNGIAEHAVKLVVGQLRTLLLQGGHPPSAWVDRLPGATAIIHDTPNTTGASPNRVLVRA